MGSPARVDEAPTGTAAALREREGDKYGGSQEGIQAHYDHDARFWELVLGPTMTYSCALFEDPDEPLERAQIRKIDWHLASANVANARTVLDVGCGWGSVLRHTSARPSVERTVGLTLSPLQADYLRSLNLPRVEVRVENWATHEPARPYDSIISVGALEHFAKREETPEEKVAVYADFFARCHKWLTPSGRLSLQTIAFGDMRREDASDFMNREIFPDSDLPFLGEIVAAAEGLFEIVAFRNDRLHYARTYDRWATNLRRHRAEAVKLVGEETVARTERYFKLTSMGFRLGKQHLLRFMLRPISPHWSVNGTDHWGPRGA